VFSGDRFVVAGALAPNAPLASLRAEDIRVVSIETTNELTTVYNLEVARAHTFFVGESAIWVHNLKDPKDPRTRRTILAKIAPPERRPRVG
jgi:hypothetical protein